MRRDPNMIMAVFDALPSYVFVVDEDIRIHEYNASASTLLLGSRDQILSKRAGDVLHCRHSRESELGCGHAAFCKNCVIRNTVGEAFMGRRIAGRSARMEIVREGGIREIYALITATKVSIKEMSRVVLVVEDISEITRLHRMIPICSVCKNIRVDKESWIKVESYFKQNLDLTFSHGLCPDCHREELAKMTTDANRLLKDSQGPKSVLEGPANP